MQTAKRQHASVMIQHLLDAPYRYRFAQLLNILVRTLHRQGIPYSRAFSHVLRFRNSLSLAFPASASSSWTRKSRTSIFSTQSKARIR